MSHKVFRMFRLRISAKKSQFCTQKFSWCGRIFHKGQYSYEPISNLDNFHPPKTTGELSKLVHGLNWRSMELPNFARIIRPFRDLLEEQPRRPKTKPIKGWTKQHTKQFQDLKRAILHRCALAIFNPKTHFPVMTTDASDGYWSSCLWACAKADRDIPIEQRRMQPIAFLSGCFKDASRRWSILDKEAFPIIRTYQRHNWLLAGSNPELLTDNKNLNYIFNPNSYLKDNSATLGRVSRWAQYLSRFRFTINHIKGENNVWADMLSRHTSPAIVAALNIGSAPSITSEELRIKVRASQKRALFTFDREQDIYSW